MALEKITVLTVTNNDKVNHLVRKINAVASDVVVLEVKEPVDILHSEANVRLLKFYAERTGKQLYYQTALSEVAQFLTAQGLDEYKPLVEEPVATVDSEEKLPRFRPRLRHLFWIPALIAVAGFFVLYAPEPTKIILVPEKERYAVRFQFNVADLETVPVTTEFTIVEELPSSGRNIRGVTAAQGSVVLINDSAQTIQVPKGTIVTTSGGTRFTTLETVKVPARKTEYFYEIPVGLKAGQAEVKVQAVEKGKAGNVVAGRITQIEGLASLKVTNPEPTFGGDDQSLPVVSEADLTSLRERLEEQVAGQVFEQLQLVAGSDYQLLEPNLAWDFVELNFSQTPGQEAGILRGTAVVQASGQALSMSFLQNRLASLVKEEVDKNGKKLYSNPEIVEFAQESDGLVVCQVQAVVTPVFSEADLVNKVVGRSTQEAVAELRSVQGVKDVRIAGDAARLPSRKSLILLQVTTEPETVLTNGL